MTRTREGRRRGRSERGQTLVEGAMALLVFFALLFAVIDCGLVLVSHQSLVERVRSAVRWGVVRPWDGTGEQIANLILYEQPSEPRSATGGYLGLTRENVQVSYQPSSTARPDDEVLSVAIVNYHYQFLSPWITQIFVNPRPVLITAPMAYRAPGL
jgi:TadE-like protein